MSLPGAGWILAYTIAAEIGDIARFANPTKLVGCTGLCPRVYQSGETDHRGSLAKCGPRYLRWALIEAAVHGARHPVYQERYQRTARRLGRQRGTKIARVDIARRMAESIWHMLTTNQPFAPEAPPRFWPRDGPYSNCATGANTPIGLILAKTRAIEN